MKCPCCGHPSRKQPAEFELRVLTVTAGPRKNEVVFMLTPEGEPIERCYTNEGCGEVFMSGEHDAARDAAVALVNAKHPEFKKLLETIRQETKHKDKRKARR
jgi:hypothetical protein